MSEHLAGDVLRLCVETGITPRYQRCRDRRVYCRHVPNGFISSKHCHRIATEQPYYRVTVADYSTILAGRNGTFQWVAAGAVG